VNRLSADTNYFLKWIAPVLVYCAISAYMLWKESRKESPQFTILIAVLAVVAIIFFVVFKRRMWSLADEVLDGGDYLVVRFGDQQQSISLANVTRVDAENQLGATTVRLRLSVPCEFGSVVSFMAKSTSRNPFALNAVAEDLIARVNDRK